MAINSSQTNSDMPFSVDIDNYDDANVVSFDSTVTHKIGKIKAAIKQLSRSHGPLDQHLANEFKTSLGTSNWWFAPGTDCEILKVGGKGWKKGKVKLKIVVEFYPDEPEFENLSKSNKQEVNQVEQSLDDIRLTMDKLR